MTTILRLMRSKPAILIGVVLALLVLVTDNRVYAAERSTAANTGLQAVSW